MAHHVDSGKEDRWLQIVRLWRQSRLSVRDFCERRGVSEPSFYGWRRVLRERGLVDDREVPSRGRGLPAFVKVAEAASCVPAAIELIVSEGRLLRIRPGFDADALRQLLRVLEEPSC